MKISIVERTRQNGLLSISLVGELTYVNAPTAKNEIRSLVDQEVKTLILGLGSVPFMDSAGIGVVVSLLKEMYARCGVLALAEIQDNVGKVFWIAKLDKLLPIYDTLAEAEADLLNCAVDNRSLQSAGE